MRRWRNARRNAAIRSVVESHLGHWQNARALYREDDRVSLVRLDDPITADKRGLSATCVLVPTPGLAIRPARWTIFLSWEASTFTHDMWHSPYVPMTVWFDPSVIDTTLQFVSRLHAADPNIPSVPTAIPATIRLWLKSLPDNPESAAGQAARDAGGGGEIG